MHHRFAAALATAYGMIVEIQRSARDTGGIGLRPRWPMIILRSPKGWTGPEQVDGIRVEGTWRAHQVPLSGVRENRDLRLLEEWMRSYRPEELFDADGTPVQLVREASPPAELRMSASPHANGESSAARLIFRTSAISACRLTQPARSAPSRRGSSALCSRRSTAAIPTVFRLFCPDETNSNRLGAVFDVSDRAFMERIESGDVQISHDGRVMEVLSEHNCHGWLEGYTLTGRHGMLRRTKRSPW